MSEEIKPTPDEQQQQGAPVLPASQKRNQHLKVEDPKSEQCTGRATVAEKQRIQVALNARKQDGKPYDIVRFCLDMMDHIEDDFLQSFKTK